MCCNCKNKTDYFIVYQRSLGEYCSECLAKHIKEFSPKGYIIPVEYMPISNFWPFPNVEVNKIRYAYGKTFEEHMKWLRETDKFVPDMNIL